MIYLLINLIHSPLGQKDNNIMAKITKISAGNMVVNVAHKDAIQMIKANPEFSVEFFPIPHEPTVTGMEATMALMLEKTGAYMIELHGDSVTRYEVTIN